MITAIGAWLLIMALALGLILPAVVVLMLQKRGRGKADLTRRKRKHEDALFDPFLTRLEDRDAVWLEEDGELPADLADVLVEGGKAKRREGE